MELRAKQMGLLEVLEERFQHLKKLFVLFGMRGGRFSALMARIPEALSQGTSISRISTTSQRPARELILLFNNYRKTSCFGVYIYYYESTRFSSN